MQITAEEIASRQSSVFCEEYLLQAYEDHKDSTKFVQHTEFDKLAIIIEPRFDKLTDAVIFNFMHFLNPLGWNLLIVSYSGYRTEIKEKYPYAIVCDIGDKHIYFNDQGIPNITIDSYNAILMDIELWKNLVVENILVFQRDCIMFRPFNDRFLKYDYAGANYFQNLAPIYGGINGGCSLRKRSTMIQCLESITWDEIDQYRTQRKYSCFNIYDNLSRNEDVFFTHACEILCKVVPDFHHREYFAIEAQVSTNAAVYHGWNKNLIPDQCVKDMLRGSPLFSKYIQLSDLSGTTIKHLKKTPSRTTRRINKFDDLGMRVIPSDGTHYSIEGLSVIMKDRCVNGDIIKLYKNGKLIRQTFISLLALKEKIRFYRNKQLPIWVDQDEPREMVADVSPSADADTQKKTIGIHSGSNWNFIKSKVGFSIDSSFYDDILKEEDLDDETEEENNGEGSSNV